MKESMEVASTVAWNMLPLRKQNTLLKNWKHGNMGIHIHCPEGSTPKDGPSAGQAITLALISLYTNIPINNKIAITGEIDLNGNALEIGGLEEKILGAIEVGITHILCPYQNKKDVELFRSEHKNAPIEITFINSISDTMMYALEKNTIKFNSSKNTLG